MRWFGRATLVAVAALTLVGAVGAPAHAAVAVFTQQANWGTGYAGAFTVTNNTPTPLSSWTLEFDLPPGTAIISPPCCYTYTVIGNHYVFHSPPWAGPLAPNASFTVGFAAAGQGLPYNCRINGAPCSGSPPPV